jgi:N-carbamoyl-L-amino-acid hydrolase
VTTRRPLEVVVWQNEEGYAFNNGLAGSRAAAAHLDAGELDAVWNGMKKADAIRKIGGAPERIAEAARGKGSFVCYLELHIEQGGNLEKAGVDIGIVEGIVAIARSMSRSAGLPITPARRRCRSGRTRWSRHRSLWSR